MLQSAEGGLNYSAAARVTIRRRVLLLFRALLQCVSAAPLLTRPSLQIKLPEPPRQIRQSHVATINMSVINRAGQNIPAAEF